MKLLRKLSLFCLIFIILFVAAALSWLYLCHGSNNLELPGKIPEASYILLGNIERNTAAINRWLDSSAFRSVSRLLDRKEAALVIAHYQNPYPSETEKKLLAQCGLDLVTLPFLSDEELEFMEETDSSVKDRDNLSLLYPGGEKALGTTLLHLSLATGTEPFAVLSDRDNRDKLIVKVSPAPGEETGDNPPFLSQARLAAENGARIIIGDHGERPGPLEIRQESLLVPGLGSFLGKLSDEGSLLLSVELYDEGLKVEAYPLAATREGTILLNMPWHYFQAQKILEENLPPCFLREPFRGVYVSPGLVKAEEPEEPSSEKKEDDETRGEAEKKEGAFGVAAAHPLAVEAGMEILRDGGNAVDAAIATAYTLGVVEPQGSGLGGGGIMLIHLAAENRQVVIDYRETAPYNISKNEIEKIMNWPSTGIPGFVKGLELAAVEYGSFSYAKLIEPAFALARDGFPMSSDLRRRVNSNSGKLARGATAMQDFFRQGWPAPVGEIITQPALAKTLASIMREGSSVFYEGYIANSILAELAKQGMNISEHDLKTYEPVVQEAISADYRGYNVVTVPPPAGGFALLQQLMILNYFSLAGSEEPEPEIFKLLVQVLKAAYSDRRSYVGDPRFVHVPLDDLLAKEYILEKVTQINNGEVPLEIFTDPCRPSDNTTHLVVRDSEGNWVSMTNTISYLFGYGLQAEGFFLNTQLNNFSTDTKSPNYYQPGKRPFSHISPTLVFKNGQPLLGLGTPGGRRIPAFLVQVLVRHIDYGWDIKAAAAAPRFWSEGKEILVESGFSKDVLAAFRKQGLFVTTQKPNLAFGRFSALYLDEEGRLDGTGDNIRGEGAAGVENRFISSPPLP